MKLQPIVYTTDMDRSVDFYERVLACAPVYRSPVWTSFAVGGAALGIHRVDHLPEGARGELSLIATQPLEAVRERLEAVGISPRRGIQDETFGRSLLLVDPDGSPLQVNEHA